MTCMIALERDMAAYQFDDMDARPGYYKKTPIRRPAVGVVATVERYKEWYRQSSSLVDSSR
jgi:hypothetical protein